MGHFALILSDFCEMESKSACSVACIRKFAAKEPGNSLALDELVAGAFFPNRRFSTFRHTCSGSTFRLMRSEIALCDSTV